MNAREKFDAAAAKYRRTYDRLYVQSMKASSKEECDRLDAALTAANAEYDAAKAAFEWEQKAARRSEVRAAGRAYHRRAGQ